MKHVQKGFTLIELMIVIAIIAILLALALPAYQDYSIRAKVGEGLSVAAAAKLAVAETCQTNPLTAIDNDTIGYAFTQSKYVASVTATPGAGGCTTPIITVVTRETGAATQPTLVLTGQYADGAGRFDWVCTHSTGESRHVPATCRTSG